MMEYKQVTEDEEIAKYTYVTKWKIYRLWNSWMFYLFDLFLYINHSICILIDHEGCHITMICLTLKNNFMCLIWEFYDVAIWKIAFLLIFL